VKKVSLGLIGAGSITRHAHAGSFGKIPGVELAAICDPVRERAEAIAAEHSIPNVFEGYKPLLGLGLDAVVVATPNSLHAPIAIAALKSGAHVLCEKPLAIKGSQGMKMVRAARAAKRNLIIGCPRRYSDNGAVLRDYIRRGKLGDVYYARVSYVRRRGTPGVGSWFTQKSLAGGGPLMDIGVHMIDLIMWLTDFPKALTASGSVHHAFTDPSSIIPGGWGYHERGGKIDVEDSGFGMVRFEGGMTLLVEATWSINLPDTGTWVQLAGTKGGARFDDLEIATEEGGRLVNVKPEVKKVNTYDEQAVKFIEAVRSGKVVSDGEDALRVTEVLEALYRSAELKKEVPVKHASP